MLFQFFYTNVKAERFVIKAEPVLAKVGALLGTWNTMLKGVNKQNSYIEQNHLEPRKTKGSKKKINIGREWTVSSVILLSFAPKRFDGKEKIYNQDLFFGLSALLCSENVSRV